jgi:hypothetical protein
MTDPAPGAATDVEQAVPVLHRWRRLDWRYLVPTTSWSQVAVGGAVDEALREALPLLGVVVVELGAATPPAAGSCDVVVLHHPTHAEVSAAVTAVRPGGWVYAEVCRSSGPRRHGSLPGWSRVFQRAGLEEVQLHWHAPDIRSAEEIIPLDARAAARHALLRRRGPRPRARHTAARLALAAGLLPRVVPSGSILGRRPPA